MRRNVFATRRISLEQSWCWLWAVPCLHLLFLALLSCSLSTTTAAAFVLEPVHCRKSCCFYKTTTTTRTSAIAALSSSSSTTQQQQQKQPSQKERQPHIVELIEPETQCRVVLLGCLHGSSSSCNDVRDLLQQHDNTRAVVLELCASRFANLQQRAETNKQQQQQQTSIMPSRFLGMVRKTSQQRGWTTGVAAAVLGAASGLQTALSGLEAGSEFTTAANLAASYNQCHIVLADRTVDETLRRVGDLPRVALEMMFTSQQQQQEEAASRAIRTAIFGDPSLPQHQQINMGRALWRNAAVRLDLARLTLPPLILAQSLVALGHFVITTATAAAATTTTTTGGENVSQTAVANADYLWNVWSLTLSSLSPSQIALESLTSLLTLWLGYVALVLPVTRVILCERDDPLADGIRAACRLVAEETQGEQEDEDASVVAVLGLLHVNGVAQRLLQQQQQQL